MANYEIIVLSERYPHTPSCFPCSECNRCMARKEFFYREGRKYCAGCFGQTFGLKCILCQRPIIGMSRINFVLYDNKTWHERCFKCPRCGNSFTDKGLSKTGDCLSCTRCGTDVT